MRKSICGFLYLVFSFALLSSLAQAQANTANQPERPSPGDLREEQRTIGNAYLGDADFQVKRARERLGVGNHKLAQQSGLWALEQVAYAKRRLEKHAAKIEAASGFFGRATESTRKELRDSYAQVRERYVEMEEKLDVLAEALKKAGFPILASTLDAVRSGNGDQAVAAVRAGLAQAGESAQGDKLTGEGAGAVAPVSSGATSTSVPLGSTGLSATVDASGVTINSVKIPGVFDAATQTIQSPQFGRVDLKTAQTNSAGVAFLQSDKGVVVIPPGILIPGATLNPDGTIRFADGSTSSIQDVRVSPSGQIFAGNPPREIDPSTGLSKRGQTHSGPVPQGVKFVDGNGQPITVDGDAPPFENGKRSFVRKVYIGARDTLLQREVQVNQKLEESSGTTWKVSEDLGQARSWSLRVDFSESRSTPGRLEGFLTVVDAGGATGFKVNSLSVQDEEGRHPVVEKDASGQKFKVVFTQSGDYTATVEGVSEWGSRFRFETTIPIGVR